MLSHAAPRVVQLVRAVPPRLVLALGWTVIVLYGYPGQMSVASFAYLRQARGRLGGDAGMAAFWRLCEVFIAGPSGMLFLQAALFVLGAYAILRRAVTPKVAAWTTAGLGVFPPVIASLSIISTHAMMTAWLLVGVAGLLHDRRRIQLAGLGALAVATAVQPVALVATLPLVVGLFAWRGERRRYVHAFVVWIAITASAFGADAVLGRGRLQAWNFTRPAPAAVVITVAPPPELALKSGVPTRTSELQDLARGTVGALADYTPLFIPALYAVLALLLLIIARRQRDVCAIAASGIALQVFVILTTSTVDARHAPWIVVCGCVAGVLFSARRARA